jgi:hypothetical protein
MVKIESSPQGPRPFTIFFLPRSPVQNIFGFRGEEPESIKKWRIEHEARLQERDAEEEKKKIELRNQAQKELADW